MSKTLILRPTKWLLLPGVFLFACFLLANMWVLNLDDKTTWPALVIYVCTAIQASIVYLDIKRLKKSVYYISDHSIQIQSAKDDATISLVNITKVNSSKHFRLPFTKYGKVVISANGNNHTMIGIKDASSVADIIRLAVESAIARDKRKSAPLRYTPPLHAPGTLEQKNDLVGLWQQGILTDEEFKKEMDRMK